MSCRSQFNHDFFGFALRMLGTALFFAAFSTTLATPPSWSFNPSKVGNALLEGGWELDYPLGDVNASSEFAFKPQLVYLSTRETKGLFGNQWFCPQLESTLIPKGTDFLLWTMPSGGQVGLHTLQGASSEYVSSNRDWRGSKSGNQIDITNDEGWRFTYTKGVLDQVTSPTGRKLIYQRSDDASLTLLISDPTSGASRVLCSVKKDVNHCATSLQINGSTHQFGYSQEGTFNHLVLWTPPAGDTLGMYYSPDLGILTRIVSIGAGQKIEDTIDFQSVYVPPKLKEGEAPVTAQNPEKNLANYRLKSDTYFDYNGGSNDLTAKSKTGASISKSQSDRRGVVTTKEGGVETTAYYYVAPGQTYNGKLRAVVRDGVQQFEYRYNRQNGLLIQSIDANGETTYYEYPETWHPSHAPLLDPKPVRLLRGTILKKQLIAEFAYDDYGRIILAKDAVTGESTQYGYTPKGDLSSIIGSDGSTTLFSYDAFGRRTSVTHNKLTESVEYDDCGRVKSLIAADGSRSEIAYNNRGQRASVSRNGKILSEYLYDPMGKPIGEKDALGRIKRIERDAKGHVLSETAPNGSVTRYEYDPYGRLTAQLDGNGNKIIFSYDPAGHLAKQKNPLGQTLTWLYDKKGRLVEHGNGVQTIKRGYDDQGHLLTIDYGAGEILSYTYDQKGRVISVIAAIGSPAVTTNSTPASPAASTNNPIASSASSSPTNSSPGATTPSPQTDTHVESRIEYTYDGNGRVIATRMVQGDRDLLLRYSYNTKGQRTQLLLTRVHAAIPSHGDIAGKAATCEPLQQTDCTYDSSGHLTSIVSNDDPVLTIQYNAMGHPIRKTYGNGITAFLSYDGAGRLSATSYSGGPLTAPMNLHYEWDVAGQLVSRTWNNHALSYSYDPSGQLLGAKDAESGAVLESYAYDKAGNMIMKGIGAERTFMNYDAANQLISSTAQGNNSTTYSYDAAGRLIASSQGGKRTYGWLDKVTSLSAPDGESVKFTYWPDGQLAQKTATGSAVSNSPIASESFLWDGLALLMRNDIVYVIEPHPSGGVPVASHPVDHPDTLTYTLSDILGTTLATVDQAGVHFASLTSFGQPLKSPGSGTINAPSTVAPSVPNPLPATPSYPQ